MSTQAKGVRLLRPLLKTTLAGSTLAAVIATALAWGLSASAGGGEAEQPRSKVKGATTKGKVRGATTGPRSAKGDLDKDGVSNATDTDDDNDGIPDPADPRPLSPQDPDNDGVQNATDQDDDGDGIADKKDRFKDAATGKFVDQSLDPYNRKTKPERYEEGRANNPWKYDSDSDGRPDLVEMREVLRAQARALGISVASSAKVLADFPKDVVGSLPEGWWNVIYDKDGDGKPASIDSDDRRGKAGSANYHAYIDNGVWEAVYKVELAHGNHKKGLVPTCSDCGSGTQLISPESTLPHFSIPFFFSKDGQHSGGQTAGGGASYKYKEFFTGGNKIHHFNSGHYKSAPQFQGGTSYVTVDAARSGGPADGHGHQSGGQWHWQGSHSGGGAGAVGSGGSDSTGSEGSDGHSGGGGGGGGGCSKCH